MDAKQRLNKMNQMLVTKLDEFDKDIAVYADALSEDEQNASGMKYLIYSTGDFSNPEGSGLNYTMMQTVFVTFVSVERPFIDGDVLDLIKLIKAANHSVIAVEKDHRQIDKQDSYADIVVLECKRVIKIGC